MSQRVSEEQHLRAVCPAGCEMEVWRGCSHLQHELTPIAPCKAISDGLMQAGNICRMSAMLLDLFGETQVWVCVLRILE